MTPDKIKTAVVSWLDGAKPATTITVSDAQTFADATLPRIAVGVVGAETHSPAIHGVQKVQLQITLAAHAGDSDTRATVEDWCDRVEQMINDPTLAKQALAAIAGDLDVHHWLAGGGVVEWEETTLLATWPVDVWVRRLS
jgi:hypothetical protein